MRACMHACSRQAAWQAAKQACEWGKRRRREAKEGKEMGSVERQCCSSLCEGEGMLEEGGGRTIAARALGSARQIVLWLSILV